MSIFAYHLPTFSDTKTMDFLAIAIMLLFTALLFMTYGVPVLRESMGEQSLYNSNSIDAQ